MCQLHVHRAEITLTSRFLTCGDMTSPILDTGLNWARLSPGASWGHLPCHPTHTLGIPTSTFPQLLPSLKLGHSGPT